MAASSAGRGRGTVGDAHAQLVHRRDVDQPLGDQLVGEPEVTGVEDLQLGPHPQLLNPLGARPQHVRRADVDQAALTEVQAAAVQRADVGQQLLHVREPLDAADQVGALGETGRVLGVQVQVTAHARSRVDHDVDAAVPQPLDHLAVERHLAGAVAGPRIPHVHVHDRSPGPGRRDAGLGDLFRRHRHVFRLADGVPRTGQRAGDDDLAIHRGTLPWVVGPAACAADVAAAMADRA